jgi:ribonuclease HII
MTKLDRRFRVYGLAHHKGYGTADHLKALASLGHPPSTA